MTSAVVVFSGWGRGTWGQLGWNEGSITNAGAAGQIGSVTVVPQTNVFPTGLSATGGVGSVTVITEANVFPTGLSAAGRVGPPLVWGKIVPNQNPSYTSITP